MTAILLATAIALSPIAAPSEAAADQWPATVSVFRRHAKGSGVPARIDVVPTDEHIVDDAIRLNDDHRMSLDDIEALYRAQP